MSTQLLPNKQQMKERLYKDSIHLENGCIISRLKRPPTGYPQIKIKGKRYLIHRLAFWCESSYDTLDDIPTKKKDELVVRHLCFGPQHRGCINSKHFVLGTEIQNSADRKDHGTSLEGEKHPSAKYTELQVKEVISSWRPRGHKEYNTAAQRGASFGMSSQAVIDIDNRRTWKHLHHPNGKAPFIRPPKPRKCEYNPTSSDYEKVLEKLLQNSTIDPITGCWLWNMGLNVAGYAWVSFMGISKGGHIIAAEIANGNQPIEDEFLACHRCNVHACVNPEHMYVGTSRDNARDVLFHNESLSHKIKITDLPSIYSSPLSHRELAKTFDVGHKHISAIRNGMFWKDIYHQYIQDNGPLDTNQWATLLTEQQVIEIYQSTMTNVEIAEKYGKSENMINLIRKGKRWNELYKEHYKIQD